MDKMAKRIYRWLRGSRLSFLFTEQVREDLCRLHPGELPETLAEEFYSGKIKLFCLVILAGFLLGAGALASSAQGRYLFAGNQLRRGDYREGAREVVLRTPSLKERQFHLTLYPTELPAEEKEELATEFLEELQNRILGKNEDLQHVWRDLVLASTYEGMPFEVEWESNRQDLMDSWGSVGAAKEETGVKLSAILRWGDFRKEGVIEITVVPVPRTEQELREDALEEYLLTAERENRGESDLELPNVWEGETLTWEQEVEDYSLLIWTLTPAIAVLLFLAGNRDLHKEVQERREQLRQEYPGLVNRLILYLGAGLSLRSAFERLASAYEEDAGKSCVGGEVILLVRQLRAGIPEATAYEHFGRRLGVREYLRLSTLLLQNRKRGNSALLDRLREEADSLSQEKLLTARKLGEEAGTRLLFPMVCLLGIVMVMIMMPAFGVV